MKNILIAFLCFTFPVFGLIYSLLSEDEKKGLYLKISVI